MSWVELNILTVLVISICSFIDEDYATRGSAEPIEKDISPSAWETWVALRVLLGDVGF